MKYILKRKNKPDKHFDTKLEAEQYIYSALVRGDYELIEKPETATDGMYIRRNNFIDESVPRQNSKTANLAGEQAIIDMVNHPPHYANKTPETIQMIRAVLTKEEFIGYCKGQILKYRDRAHDKGNLEQDMAKAKFYYDLLEEVRDERD